MGILGPMDIVGIGDFRVGGVGDGGGWSREVGVWGRRRVGVRGVEVGDGEVGDGGVGNGDVWVGGG